MSEIRNTKQKDIILEYLNKHKNEHLTIEKIKKDLSEIVGEATIYRLIKKLIIEGEITKIPLSKQGFCYKFNNKKCSCEEEFHLICEKCGSIYHLKTNIMDILEKKAREDMEFEISKENISFYGICKNCRG